MKERSKVKAHEKILNENERKALESREAAIKKEHKEYLKKQLFNAH